jgi:hypothetical protein
MLRFQKITIEWNIVEQSIFSCKKWYKYPIIWSEILPDVGKNNINLSPSNIQHILNHQTLSTLKQNNTGAPLNEDCILERPENSCITMFVPSHTSFTICGYVSLYHHQISCQATFFPQKFQDYCNTCWKCMSLDHMHIGRCGIAYCCCIHPSLFLIPTVALFMSYSNRCIASLLPLVIRPLFHVTPEKKSNEFKLGDCVGQAISPLLSLHLLS